MRAFILVELLLAMLVMIFALHLFFDFSKNYSHHLDTLSWLDSISSAQVDLIEHQNISKQYVIFETTSLRCDAILNRTNGDVVYHQFEIKTCK